MVLVEAEQLVLALESALVAGEDSQQVLALVSGEDSQQGSRAAAVGVLQGDWLVVKPTLGSAVRSLPVSAVS
jgi:hypothetical protein